MIESVIQGLKLAGQIMFLILGLTLLAVGIIKLIWRFQDKRIGEVKK